MDYKHDEIRMNVECDRLSNLPHDLIIKILTCMCIKQAIQTSALSSRWRYIWTSMPRLTFSTDDFLTLPDFSKFVRHVLSSRNDQIDVSYVKLKFRGNPSQAFVKRILDYALCHNVQKLRITCLNGKKIKFPVSLFSFRSLKHLTLTGFFSILTTLTWKLSALTTLDLCLVTLYNDNTTDKCGGLFSNCANLKKLTIKNCRMMSANGFTICHPELSSLTLESGCLDVNLVVPRLKNLTIKYWPAKFLISAPDLFSLRYRDEYDFLELSADFLHLEKVDICICCSSKDKKDARKIICLLQQLHSVKSLTLNSESIKVLSSYTKLISHQPSPFTKLNGLKIYPRYVDEKQSEFTLATEVKKYLLDSSPDATFTMVSHEEIIAVKNVTIARKLMIKLGAALDKLKENSETNTSDMDQDEAPSESHIATVEEQVEDLNEVVMTGTSRITEILQEIEETLTKLPKSHRDKLQARFYCLCAEADTVMRPIV